jgi:hypothetical protein
MVIAFIYTNNMSLMLRPEVFVEKYQSGAGGWHLNLDDPTLIPRYVHNLLSAIAVASLAVSLFGLLKLKTDESFGKWAIRRGSIWFGAVTLVNMGAGLWYLFSLDREVIRAIMNPIGATGLMLGILGGLVAIFLVMQAMNAAKPKLPVLGAAGALFISLISMLLLRDQLRQIRLSLSGYEIMPWVDTDWGLIGLFVVLLLVAVGTVLWMVAVLLKKRG